MGTAEPFILFYKLVSKRLWTLLDVDSPRSIEASALAEEPNHMHAPTVH